MTHVVPARRPAADRSSVVPGQQARWWARLAGVVAGLAGLGFADIVAWFISPAGSPLTAVGELIIKLLPGPLVNFGKDTLGTADKPILLVIIALGVLAACGFAGQVELARRSAGAMVFALVALIGVAGVAVRVGGSIRGYLPTLVGLLLGYLILHLLITRLARWLAGEVSDTDQQRSPAESRRAFLGLTIIVGAAGLVGTFAGRALAGVANAVSETRSRLQLPKPSQAGDPVPAGAELNIDGLSPYVTANQDFYRIDTALQVPVINPDTWSLKVTGMVEREVEISFADLSSRPLVEHLTTLTCVSNNVGGNLIGNARWLGYPIRDLLAQARPLPAADMVLSRSDDGWTAGTPLSALIDPERQSLLAIGMNGEPLPIEHGFPVRMVVPGLYGYVSATKWVVELKVTTFAADMGYWTPLGWSARGPIKLSSRIDTPRRAIDPGQVTVAGVAWAQHTGIAGVEVRIDGGPWEPATLAETAGPDTWRQWSYPWQAARGNHFIAVRATDNNGTVQTQETAPAAPDGATGFHSVSVKVR